jgi:hypothetical protein
VPLAPLTGYLAGDGGVQYRLPVAVQELLRPRQRLLTGLDLAEQLVDLFDNSSLFVCRGDWQNCFENHCPGKLHLISRAGLHVPQLVLNRWRHDPVVKKLRLVPSRSDDRHVTIDNSLL